MAKPNSAVINALSGQDDYGVKGTLMIVGDPKQSIYRVAEKQNNSSN
jgi:superfamily I DNA/RNA helicase